MYDEYRQSHFVLDGHEGTLIYPEAPRWGNPYIWRAEFLGEFDSVDRELLRRGWHLAYYKVSDQFGAREAIKKMRRFQTHLEQEFALCKTAVLFGFSRGGLYAVNYAAAYPEKVRKLYLDAPALDIFSWPGGFGRGIGSVPDWELCRKRYQIPEGQRDVADNPVNQIERLIQNRIPVLLVAGDTDTVVPFRENGMLLYADYVRAGAPVKLIVKPGAGHHPHSLEEPEELADWIEFDSEYGCIIEEGAKQWQIFQQLDGFAEIALRGRCVHNAEKDSYHAFVRVVDELDGRPVINWRQCETQANDWSVSLQVPVGGLYRIETCMQAGQDCTEWSIRGDSVSHIGVGDVFVIAGQSNSAGRGMDSITDEQELGVHLLKNNGCWDIAAHPMNDSTGTIHPQNRDKANPGHSPYLSFAKYLKRALGYPIGLVQASLGGSQLKLWQKESGSLYRNLLEIVRPLNGVKAILWYQGCSDVGAGLCETYEVRFGEMVRDMREQLGMPELPFLTCQIHKETKKSNPEKNRGWGMVREAQRQAAKTIKNVYVVPTSGGMLSDHIHNSAPANLVLGERLAKCALGHLYGRTIMCDAPNLIRAVRTGDRTITMEFENVYDQLKWYSEEAEDKIFWLESAGKRTAVQSCNFIGANKLELTFASPVAAGSLLHGAADADMPYITPVDRATRLPMLSFYAAVVEER